jgi:transcriptional regulator with XRE-family HTH domain
MSSRLRQARHGRGWSQARLIHAMQQQAVALDIRLATPASLKTQISRWENGHCQPDEVYRQVFRALYGQTDDQLGFSPEDAGGGETGLGFAETWSEGVHEVTELWKLDVSRRSLLRGSAFAAAAYGVPALRWMMSDSGEAPVRLIGHRINQTEIASIREMTRTFRTLDNAHGGGFVREQAVRYLDREVTPLLRNGSYDGTTSIEFLRASAELTQLVGWMSYDGAQHGLSQRYFIQALRLAKAADDECLGAEILAAMSHQASYLGHGSAAVDLARVAARSATTVGVPVLVAEAAVLEAQGHAERKDEKACAVALHVAETTLDRADRSHDPQWISYFDEAYMSAKFGHCFRALGQPKKAETFAKRSLDMDPTYVRGRAFNLALLATSYVQQGEVEQACLVGQQAVRLARELNSKRAVRYISEVADGLASAADHADVQLFRRDVAQLVGAA